MDKDKQGPAVYLSLDEKIRKTCSDIKVKDLHNNIKKYEMELPTGVLTYRLLISEEISEDKQQLSNINFILIWVHEEAAESHLWQS